jgi:hypothetical protein
MQVEIIHGWCPQIDKTASRGDTSARWMTNIVVPPTIPLNAHSCRCLAHFSLRLEKFAGGAHNAEVKKRSEKHDK